MEAFQIQVRSNMSTLFCILHAIGRLILIPHKMLKNVLTLESSRDKHELEEKEFHKKLWLR